jgi:acetyl esterase/lipase
MYLIIASLPSQMVEFRRLAKLIRSRGEEVKIFVERESLLSEPGAELIPQGAVSRFPYWKFWQTVRASRSAAIETYRREKPKAVIVGEDGVGGNLAWIAAAKAIGIPVVVLPYEYSGAEQAIAAIRPEIDDFRVSGLIGQIFAWLRPAWVKVVDRQHILRLPLRYALSYEVAGVAPPNPWTVHGGRADVILAESQQMEQHYKKEGIAASKIATTGSLAFDDMHEAMATASPGGDRLRILCALPPDYTASRGPLPYPDLVRLWLDEARKHGDVTVQAHPAARESLNKIGVAFDTRDITTLIAENDLLVTSVSSIIRYALAARRPVLNFDCYRFDYPDYVKAAGCTTVSSVEEYRAALGHIADHFETYRGVSASEASYWGVIDGKSSERTAAVLGL